jgi:signal transduction histidine kinase
VPRELPSLAREVLENAARVLQAPRAVLTWEASDEPSRHVASLSGGIFAFAREEPGAPGLVAEPLADADFLCQDVRVPRPKVLLGPGSAAQTWRGMPLGPEARARYRVGSVLAVRVVAEDVRGRLLALDMRRMTEDDLILGEVVAHQVAMAIEHFYLFRRIEEAAVAEERLRLARDLHDGVLQSLSAAALQLQALRPLIEERPADVRGRLEEIQRLLAAEQRDLRLFIRQLKPASAAPEVTPESLPERLEELGRVVDRQWGLRVELRLEPFEEPLPPRLASEIYLLVREALVNAARHADASVARVELEAIGGSARITVADDGRGFAFRGRLEHPELQRHNLGPLSLRERAASLGGSLSIASDESGARVELLLPLGLPGGADAH